MVPDVQRAEQKDENEVRSEVWGKGIGAVKKKNQRPRLHERKHKDEVVLCRIVTRYTAQRRRKDSLST